MHLIRDYKNDLRDEFRGYNGKRMAKDIMAGITVAAVALPLALAFGVSSGATAAAGLVTAIIGGIIIGAFSGASFQISGPTGAMTAILVTLAAKFGMEGILIACFFAGIILVVAGILKLGRMISFIPSSVITGFTSGIALIIALGQLDNFFGVQSKGDLAIAKFFSYFTEPFNPNWQAVIIGVAVILIMILWPKKLNGYFPSSLLALIIILIFNHFANFDVATVGEIPKSLFLSDRLS
ncbi:MAG: SulP family inorganic anion transporter, partial [Anaerovoracaceae bacterium]